MGAASTLQLEFKNLTVTAHACAAHNPSQPRLHFEHIEHITLGGPSKIHTTDLRAPPLHLHNKLFNGMQRLLRESRSPDKVVVVPKTFMLGTAYCLFTNKTFMFDTAYLSPTKGLSEPCSWTADVGAPPEPSVSTNTYVEGKRSPEGLTNTDGFDLEVMQFRICGGRFIDGVFALARPCDEDLVAFRIRTKEYRARIQPPVEDPIEDTSNGFLEDLGISLKTSALIPHDLGACVHVWRMSRRVWHSIRNTCETNPFHHKKIKSVTFFMAFSLLRAYASSFPLEVFLFVLNTDSFYSLIWVAGVRVLVTLITFSKLYEYTEDVVPENPESAETIIGFSQLASQYFRELVPPRVFLLVLGVDSLLSLIFGVRLLGWLTFSKPTEKVVSFKQLIVGFGWLMIRLVPWPTFFNPFYPVKILLKHLIGLSCLVCLCSTNFAHGVAAVYVLVQVFTGPLGELLWPSVRAHPWHHFCVKLKLLISLIMKLSPFRSEIEFLLFISGLVFPKIKVLTIVMVLLVSFRFARSVNNHSYVQLMVVFAVAAEFRNHHGELQDLLCCLTAVSLLNTMVTRWLVSAFQKSYQALQDRGVSMGEITASGMPLLNLKGMFFFSLLFTFPCVYVKGVMSVSQIVNWNLLSGLVIICLSYKQVSAMLQLILDMGKAMETDLCLDKLEAERILLEARETLTSERSFFSPEWCAATTALDPESLSVLIKKLLILHRQISINQWSPACRPATEGANELLCLARNAVELKNRGKIEGSTGAKTSRGHVPGGTKRKPAGSPPVAQTERSAGIAKSTRDLRSSTVKATRDAQLAEAEIVRKRLEDKRLKEQAEKEAQAELSDIGEEGDSDIESDPGSDNDSEPVSPPDTAKKPSLISRFK